MTPVYKLTYIVGNMINDIQYVDTVQEAYGAILEACYDSSEDFCLEDFYDKFHYRFAADLLTLPLNGKLLIPYTNNDGDYGGLIVEEINSHEV